MDDKYNIGKYKIGDKVVTEKEHFSMSGAFPIGTEVTVIDVSYRGYDIQNANGERIIEIGWEI